MNMDEFIEYCRAGHPIAGEDKVLHGMLTDCSFEAQRITMKLNTSYHSKEEIVEIFHELTGREVDDSFMCFPPFYTDFGKNISIGKDVFFNTGCSFQDRGGIHIGDGSLIGMNVNIATLNHGLDMKTRNTTYASPVTIGKNVWIGSGATILPGVTIGDRAVVAAGAVVTKDVPEGTVVAGVPAKVVKTIEEESE
ncbi:DapH/DapD/GlmU-related protein [Rossellomorea marisflavi]|uniref:DapH/DapD/GlmU-related protein n=1 Tax=Rossellomorea marisflavi TaxID=189381 RepID=UPI0006FBDE65|nr:DapH/DapD/GlmU-related protein [Rossellomorea marisflavi]KQU63201.1 acetyltransferase [Bacillus sp. Leaf406]MDW4525340.1 DapH/DapD/GlmU-related protein [Rossellomorea marisflavi]WJV18213.1 DapH/DapD/GlmU-related protein [Rossellomorea marisflavi]